MRTLLVTALFTLAAAVSPAAEPDSVLLDTERAWLDAYEQNDVRAMESIVGDGFVITFPSGDRQTRSELIALVGRAAAAGHTGSRLHTEDTTVQWIGADLAVLRGVIVVENERDGAPVETRNFYTDTWILNDGRWQVVASHLSE